MAKSKKRTPGITERFLMICDEVINDGLSKNKSSFMASVGEYQQSRAAMEKGTRAPTLESIVMVCELYGYSANWLILNVGDKRLKASDKKPLEGRVNDLELELAKIKRALRAK